MVKPLHNTLGHFFSPLPLLIAEGVRARIKQAFQILIQVVIGLLCYSLFSVAQSATTHDVITVSTPPLADVDRLITLSIKPTEVMLGEPVTVTIVGEHRANLFAGLDWQKFEKNFVLYDVDSSSERIKVQLYPLASGLLKIKGQTAGRMVLPDIEIKVTANPEVSIHWFGPNSTANPTSSTSLYAHQQSVWRADVQVMDTAHKVTYEQRASAINPTLTTYLKILPVDTQASGSTSKTEILVASYEVKEWQTSAPQKVLLHPPVVVVKNRSNRRWYFFDKPSSVILKPLPSFLPLTVPVGTIEWQSEPTDQIQMVGDLHYWTWRLQGKGLTQAYMNSVAYQLVAQIKHNPQIEWLSDSRETSMQLTREGMLSALTLRLPYRVTQPGLVTLPALQLRYFNPQSERLEVVLHPEKTVLALPAWLVWIGEWLLFMLSALVIFIGLLTVKQAWLNWRLQQVIKQASSVDVLWQGLIEWRQNQSYQAWSILKWSQNSADKRPSQDVSKESLGHWSHWYVERFGDSEAFFELVTELNFILYAQHDQIDSEAWQRLSNKADSWSQTLSWWKVPLIVMRARFK